MVDIPVDKEFMVEFVKRSTGEIRRIRAILRPEDESTGNGPDVRTNHLLALYDLDDNRFKTIPLEGIKQVKINGTWLQWRSDVEAVPERPSTTGTVHEQVPNLERPDTEGED